MHSAQGLQDNTERLVPKDLCDPESGDSRPESTWGSIAGHFAACSDDMASRAGAADFGRNSSIETIACSMLLFRFNPFLSVYRARRQDVGSQRLEGLRVRPIGPPWMLQPCNRNLTAGDGRSRGIIRGNISKLISLPLSLGSPRWQHSHRPAHLPWPRQNTTARDPLRLQNTLSKLIGTPPWTRRD